MVHSVIQRFRRLRSNPSVASPRREQNSRVDSSRTGGFAAGSKTGKLRLRALGGSFQLRCARKRHFFIEAKAAEMKAMVAEGVEENQRKRKHQKSTASTPFFIFKIVFIDFY